VIEREILIEAPIQLVWRTITEPDQISHWFADGVELVLEPGGHGYMGVRRPGRPGRCGEDRSTDSLLVPLELPAAAAAGLRQLDSG